MDLSLPDLIPLWRTLREGGVTALVTPSLDYVGGLELSTTDLRFAGDGEIEQFGEALRNMVSSLDDDCQMLFLYRVTEDAEDDVRAYEAAVRNASPAALKAYVDSRSSWLREQKLRRVRVFMFFALGAAEGDAPGTLALRLAFRNAEKLSQQAHLDRLSALAGFRDRLQSRFAAQGVTSRELTLQEVWQLHYQLLNPGRSRTQRSAPILQVRDDLWADSAIRAHGEHLRELTEAEQLVFEDLQEYRGYFVQGGVFRRALTLKLLPERGTSHFGVEDLLSLSARAADGQDSAFGYTLAVAVRVERQTGVTSPRARLKQSHALVQALSNIIPGLKAQDIDKEAADAAKQGDLLGLFAEFNTMSSKLAALSVTLLLDANSLVDLDARTEAARSAFGRMGNSELLDESVTQLPAYLSVFPGCLNRQLRRKGCTTRNAADYLPLFAPWRGTTRPASLLFSPTGDAFRFDFFDKTLAEAHHGFVAADTGSGKSFSFGLLILDALASGTDAILVDNGESWRPLTELMEGTHISVNLKESISPFAEYSRMLDEGTNEIGPQALQDVVNFLEVCVTEPNHQGFHILDTDLVSRVVRQVYESHFRDHPTQRPLIGHFRDALVAHDGSADETSRAKSIAARLAIYCDGMYASFLNQESKLRFDQRLLTFEMKQVSDIPAVKKLGMAAIIQAIGSRAVGASRGPRRPRTIVAVDEGHEYLGTDEVAQRFLAGCYRKMRKYDVAMWMLSQQLNDFVKSPVADAILGNAHLKIFLKHGAGNNQRSVVDYFELSPRAANAFASLSRKRGHYSDFFLMYGSSSTTVRLAVHPLAYWILTTDKTDKDLIERARAKNPRLDRLTILQELAALYPHGAPVAPVRTATLKEAS